jgi:DNA-binding SARP family transcriptional activator
VAAEMEFCLLGPLLVRRGGILVPVPPGQQRALLAALLLRAGRPVPVDDLAEVLWGSRPPRSARTSLQNCVMRLRRSLGEDAGVSRITTQPEGYLVSVGAGELDVERFESSLAAAREAARAGVWVAAAAQLRAALSLWRGQPLSGVPSDTLALREVPRLAEMRLQALEARINADLHLGRHTDVIIELRQLTAAHPLQERLHALLMIALYRNGQQAGALAAYQAAREVLVNELGAEPGRELRQLHQQILTADAALAVHAHAGAIAGSPETRQTSPGQQTGPEAPHQRPAAQGADRAVLPRQLPRAIPGFIGRAEHLESLSAALAQADRQGSPRPIWVISGAAGVGKSSLALRWAHSVVDRFPDGQMHVDLRGFGPAGPPATLGQLIRRMLDMLQGPAERTPASLDAQLDLYRSLLADKRVVVVLDNARDPDQVRALLPAGPGCLVLVTSRDRLLGLAASHGAHLLTLDVFTDAEAHELLARGLPSRSRPGKEEEAAAAEIIRLCDRLPLALAIVVARAQSQRVRTLAALANDLRGAPVRLDALDAGDARASVRTVFSWSHRELTPAAARTFRFLGLHRGPDISTQAVAGLAGMTLPDAQKVTAELTRVHMITEHAPQRFAVHDLLRAYAIEELRDHEDDTERRAAVRRVLDYYLYTSYTAALSINQARDALELAPACAGSMPEEISERGRAYDWFRAEYQVLLQAVSLAVDNGYDDYAWQIPWTLVNFFDQQGYWQDWIATHQIALSAAQRSDNLLGQASSHQNISIVYVHLGHYDAAQSHLQRAITLNRKLGIRAGQARCLLDIARAFECQDRYRDALEHASTARKIYEELGHQFGQARALNAVGWNYAHLGNIRHAIICCQQALAIHGQLGNRMGQAATLDSLGYAHTQLGQHTDAVDCYQRALDLLGRGERTYQHACVLTELATSYQAARNDVAATDASLEALSILQALRHPDADRTRARLSEAGISIR